MHHTPLTKTGNKQLFDGPEPCRQASLVYKIPIGIALGVVAGILLISVIASILLPKKVRMVPTEINRSDNAPESNNTHQSNEKL